MEKFSNYFNVRVYGVCIHEGKLLISDEIQNGLTFSKLPGGGLEFGEGIADCLKREFQEEMEVEIEIGELLYINDFFQPSAFNHKSQVIAVYYKVSLISQPKVSITEIPFNFTSMENGSLAFRWLPVNSLREEDFYFPIDKRVAAKIIGLNINSVYPKPPL